jgi:hypothetical protein
LCDLEEDVEMRQAINLYKAKGGKAGTHKKGGQYGMYVDDAGAVPASRSIKEAAPANSDMEGEGEEIGPSLDDLHTSNEEEAE